MNNTRRSAGIGTAMLIAASSAIVTRADAQSLVVVVTDSSRGTPLEDAMVSLLDQSADLLLAQRTPADGRVTLRVTTGAGHYAVRVERTGYQGIVSNWIPVGDADTLEVTMRLSRVTGLPEVVIAAQIDSITPLLPPGVNPKAIAGRVIVPDEVARHAMGARDYVDIISSVGVAGLATTHVAGNRFRANHRCVASLRSVSTRECLAVYVNNMRTTPDQAADLATPENLDFAVWLRPEDAGVLYGTGTMDGVLLLYTKDWRRARATRPPP